MTFPLRRIVTSHDEQGNATVKIDEIAQHWREGKFTMVPGGSVFRILDFKPGIERRMHRTD